jgi:hypothetical protein
VLTWPGASCLVAGGRCGKFAVIELATDVVQNRGVMSVSVGIDSANDDAAAGIMRVISVLLLFRIQRHPLSWHAMLEWDGQASDGRSRPLI